MTNTLFDKVIKALNHSYKVECMREQAASSLQEELVSAFAKSKMPHLAFRAALIAALEAASDDKWTYNTKYALRVLCDIDSKFRLRAERNDAGTKKVPAWQKHVNAINALTGRERAQALAAIVAGK
jgi:hypothetical protein